MHVSPILQRRRVGGRAGEPEIVFCLRMRALEQEGVQSSQWRHPRRRKTYSAPGQTNRQGDQLVIVRTEYLAGPRPASFSANKQCPRGARSVFEIRHKSTLVSFYVCQFFTPLSPPSATAPSLTCKKQKQI